MEENHLALYFLRYTVFIIIVKMECQIAFSRGKHLCFRDKGGFWGCLLSRDGISIDCQSFKGRIYFEPPIHWLMIDDVPVAVEHRKMALISIHRQKISDR